MILPPNSHADKIGFEVLLLAERGEGSNLESGGGDGASIWKLVREAPESVFAQVKPSAD